MTLDDAYQILGVRSTSSEAERHAAFYAKQQALEGKLKSAPTDGLRKKYQDALQDLEQAIELAEESANQDLLSNRNLNPSTVSSVDEADISQKSELPKVPVSGNAYNSKHKCKLGMICVLIGILGTAAWWLLLEQPRRDAELLALREAERQSLSQLVKVQLNQLHSYIERLEAWQVELASKRDRLRVEMDHCEQDGDGNSPRYQYYSLRWTQIEAYLEWFHEVGVLWKVQRPRSKAQQAIKAGYLNTAAKWSAEGVAIQESLEIEVIQVYDTKYADVLIEWISGVDQGQYWLVKWLHSEEPQLVARKMDNLRKELSYLDDELAKPDALTRLNILALLAGERDSDFVRWLEKISSSLPKEGEAWTVTLGADTTIQLLYVEAGSFMMGSRGPNLTPSDKHKAVGFGSGTKADSTMMGERGRDEDETQHLVTLTEGYWLGQAEITQGQWEALMGNDLSDQHIQSGSRESLRGEGAKYPMYYVSWEEAMEFCRQLTAQEHAAQRLPSNLEYTLPTEAQWEYACRAGTQTRFHYGNHLDPSMANCGGNYPASDDVNEIYRIANLEGQTLPVGSYQANDWGFFDMHGSLYEWCSDWYGAYPDIATQDPAGPEIGTRRVYRGGSSFSLSGQCRSADRSKAKPHSRGEQTGFRIALRSIR